MPKKPAKTTVKQLSDRDMQTWAVIQHLLKQKKELELSIRQLKATLPDREPATVKRPVKVLNPQGKWEDVKCR